MKLKEILPHVVVFVIVLASFVSGVECQKHKTKSQLSKIEAKAFGYGMTDTLFLLGPPAGITLSDLCSANETTSFIDAPGFIDLTQNPMILSAVVDDFKSINKYCNGRTNENLHHTDPVAKSN